MDALRFKMSSLTPHGKRHKVAVVGSGNWGSTIAKMVAENVKANPDIFEPEVQMWVYEETVSLPESSKHYVPSSHLSTEPQPLTKLINQYHENVKYLPGIPLPHNVIANPSLIDAVTGATILVFNLPHQFIGGLCKQMNGHIVPYARGISCIKGVDVQGSEIQLFSESIGSQLGIYCGALSGANIANEVAQEKFSETTIAYDQPPMDSQNPTPATSAGPSPESSHVDLTQLVHKDASGKKSKIKLRALPQDYPPIDHHTLKTLFHRPYFHVRVVSDVAGVSLSGALKNIVALAAGFVDGLGWGDNAKAAVMRVGLLEMVKFGKMFFGRTVSTATFTEESAGVADLITTCSGGRNHRCAKLSIERGVSIEEVEAQELNGQKLQGTSTTAEVNSFLKSRDQEKDFPLFTAVYKILQGEAKPQDLPDLIEPSSDLGSNSDAKPRNADMPDTHPLSDAPLGATDVFSQPSDYKPIVRHIKVAASDRAKSSHRIHATLRPPHPLSTSRYTRQLLLPQISLSGHSRLSSARVLIIGLGGLGCPASIYLAAAGLGSIGLLDSDMVELSNLHRQILHREDSVGWTKVRSAVRNLREINSQINLLGYEEAFTPSNAINIAKHYDLILDCTDNPQTRYLISDVAVALGKTVVSAAAQRMEGQCMILNYPVGEGPCYRCVFPKSPKAEMVVSCEEVGVLGTAVGTMGVIMAGEAIRVLVQGQEGGKDRKPGMLLFNAWAETTSMFRGVKLRGKRKSCIACGDVEDIANGHSKITAESIENGGVDYVAFCGTREDVKVLESDQRIRSRKFLEEADSTIRADNVKAGREEEDRIIVDVREPPEFALGAQVNGSVNIPISLILRTRLKVSTDNYGGDPGSGNEKPSSGPDPALLALLNPLPPDEDGHPKPDDLYSTNAERREDTTPNSSERTLTFICQRGNDSQLAAKRFIDGGFVARNGWGWVGDVEGGIDAMARDT